jgi:hypothetical protein
MAHGPDPVVSDRRAADPMHVCIVGASGELGRYTVEHLTTGDTRWSPSGRSRGAPGPERAQAPSAAKRTDGSSQALRRSSLVQPVPEIRGIGAVAAPFNG